jgi:hypothetical protein
MKQAGALALDDNGEQLRFKDRAGANPAEWDEDLQVQEFPQGAIC